MTVQPRGHITKASVNLVSTAMLSDNVVTAPKHGHDAIALIHTAVDETSSLFYVSKEVDFGSSSAVDTKITDAIPAKGKLVSVQAVVTEVFNGDADSTITISKAASGATPMSSTIVVDKDAAAAGNWLGAAFGVLPNADGTETVLSGGDVYAYSGANTNRSTGKMQFTLLFMKTA